MSPCFLYALQLDAQTTLLSSEADTPFPPLRTERQNDESTKSFCSCAELKCVQKYRWYTTLFELSLVLQAPYPTSIRWFGIDAVYGKSTFLLTFRLNHPSVVRDRLLQHFSRVKQRSLKESWKAPNGVFACSTPICWSSAPLG